MKNYKKKKPIVLETEMGDVIAIRHMAEWAFVKSFMNRPAGDYETEVCDIRLKDKEYEKAITILEEHLADFSKHGKKQALEILISCCDQIGDKEKKEEYEKRLKELEEED